MTERTFSFPSVLLLFSAPAIGGALFGYDIGSTSYVISQLQSPNYSSSHSDDTWWQTVQKSAVLQGCVVSAASAGAFIGSGLVYKLADRLGRKTELQLGATLYLFATATMVAAGWQLAFGFSWTLLKNWAFFVLILGRIIYGVGIGITMHAAPTYLAEMIPPSIRGLFVSLKEASIVLGILVGYVIGYIFYERPGGWVVTYGCSCLGSLLMLLLTFYIPESCRWLSLQKRPEDARNAIAFVYHSDHVQAEYEQFREQLREQYDANEVDQTVEGSNSGEHVDRTPLVLWKNPRCRLALVAGIGLVVLQQVTGQPTVLSYAASIFKQTGLSDSSSVIVAAFKLVSTLSAAATVERFGRKKLLYIGCSCMLLALLGLSLSFSSSFAPSTLIASAMGETRAYDSNFSFQRLLTAEEHSSLRASSLRQGVVLICMFLYIAGYQIGFGPISWLMVSEVFPLSVRGQAVAVAVQTNFALNAFVQLVVPPLQKLIGLNAIFGIFAVLTAYSIYFVRLNVPETKGLTLEEIEAQFYNMMRESSLLTPDSSEAEPLLEPGNSQETNL